MSEKALHFREYLHLPEMKVALISLAHCINDTYAAFLATFIPFIKNNLGLSYALASNFNVIVGLFHIVCQPVIGYMCDRIRRPILMMVGPILCGLGAIMVPNVRSYGAAVFFAGLWGFGSALYHPQGSGGVGYVSKPEFLTRSLTWFNIAGTVGTMLSPVIAVAAVKAMGYNGLAVTLIPALLLAPLIYFSMPFLREEEFAPDSGDSVIIWTLGNQWSSRLVISLPLRLMDARLVKRLMHGRNPSNFWIPDFEKFKVSIVRLCVRAYIDTINNIVLIFGGHFMFIPNRSEQRDKFAFVPRTNFERCFHIFPAFSSNFAISVMHMRTTSSSCTRFESLKLARVFASS
jgi:MFS family permease